MLGPGVLPKGRYLGIPPLIAEGPGTSHVRSALYKYK